MSPIFDELEELYSRYQTQTEEIAAETRRQILSVNQNGVTIATIIKLLDC